MYDMPYRLERDEPASNNDYQLHHYTIWRTGEGVICRGTNFAEMRNLVDRANEAALQEAGHRGR
jgi:hypothetical protein